MKMKMRKKIIGLLDNIIGKLEFRYTRGELLNSSKIIFEEINFIREMIDKYELLSRIGN